MSGATTLVDSKSFHLADNSMRPPRFIVCMEYKLTFADVQGALIYFYFHTYRNRITEKERKRETLRARISLSGHLAAKLLNNSIITVSFKYLNWL